MENTKYLGAVLALCLFSAVSIAKAQSNSLTQEILQKSTFREGLVWIGDKEPDAVENKELLEVLNHLNEAWWTAGVEQFLKDHPRSPWAGSLRYDYASYCRRTGRTTKALGQFEAAWAVTKNDTSPAGQRLGGAILANWTDLLSSLGRLEKLQELVAVGDRWNFINPPDRDKFQGAKHSFYLMQEHPEIAYRCGTFAVKAIGGLLLSNLDLEGLVQIPSPTNGFSMDTLVDLARQYGLGLVAVRRTEGQELIVPSVVHWRQNHYAAILDRQGDAYLVSDPTFGHQKWLTAEVINEEASGDFLVPANVATNGWTQVARNEAATIHGMGLPNNIDDAKDKGCLPGKPCPPCKGMPVWWVSEPYINVWLADEPISYLTSRGEPFTFRITYKQRNSTAGWNNSWTSSVQLDSIIPCYNTHGCSISLSSCYAKVNLANGGQVFFNPGQSFDSETRLTLRQNTALGIFVAYPDGAIDVYGFSTTPIEVYGDNPETILLLTRHIDPNGDSTLYQYDDANGLGYVLTFVTDPDGRTNSLAYTGNLLIGVTNAYGQSASFKYDTNKNLTNIVDAQGLSSGIAYDTNGYPTALTTPYGTTAFSIFANSIVATTTNAQGNFGGHNLIDRAVQVTDPIGANYLYLYRYDCSSASPVNLSPTYSSSNVPTNTPLGTMDDGGGSSTNSLAGVCFRNSFFWGPRQFAGLSTTNMDSFSANDYLRGRMQHWLEDTNQLYLTGFLSVAQDASPDGATVGLQTFYDYQGKMSGYNFCAGTYGVPAVVAWRLPNGDNHYEYKKFDALGNVTNDITTYTLPSGATGTRTNQFIYANNVYTALIGTWNGSTIYNTASSSFTLPNLLTKVIGADGNTIAAYGGFDTVIWTNFFNIGSQTNGTTLTSSRVLPDYATNGLGQVATTTFTVGGTPVVWHDLWKGIGTSTNYNYGKYVGTTFSGYNKISSFTSVAGLTTTNIYNTGGFLAQTIELQVGRTNSFGYTTDGLIGTFTNELGLNLNATWDNLLRLTGVQFPDGSYVSNLFNKLDLGSTRDRLGNWTTFAYDGAQHLTSVSNANSAVTSYSWCGCGALTTVIDALTNVTSLNYDNQGNLTNITYPDYSSRNFQYDLAKRTISLSDGAARSLQFAYNNQGYVTGVSNAYGQIISRTVLDLRDRPVSLTDANQITVTNAYDLMDRILTRTWADGISEGYGYSTQGLVVFTNRNQRVTGYGRDVAGRITSVTNANQEVTQFAYDPANNLTNLVDGLNHTTTWQYNPFGWQTNKIDGLTRNAFRYAYNLNGWITNRWTPEKGNTGYSYDNVGNLMSISYPSATINYAYDVLNRLTNMVDSVGTTAFSYTAAGHLQSENGPWSNDTLTFAYGQGLRTNLTLLQTSGSWWQRYGYDAAWRMTNTVSPAGTFAYGYNFQPASALVTGIRLPNGASITNGYDSLARLTQTALNNFWGAALDSYSYTPDALGLRTNIVRNFGLTSSTVTAGFDNIGQLTSWNAAETGGTPRQHEQLGFGYDAANNVHTRNNGNLAQTFTTDAANELTGVTRTGTFTLSGATPAPATSVTVNGQPAQLYGDFTFAATNLALASGNNTFSNVAENSYGVRATNILTLNLPASVSLNFDGNGNLTNDGTRSFGYDAENQLTNITLAASWKSEFVYDGLNRRRIVRDFTWQSGAWVLTNETRNVYDGNQAIQERDTNGNPTVTYTRGLDLGGGLQQAGGIGGLLARSDTNGSTFYHADGMGNVTALMDGSENIVARYLYNPFGKLIGQWGRLATANTMQFSSMPQLRGIVLFPFRGYEPNFQRFLNEDPIQEAGGINLHRFVRNNPTRFFDPLGLMGGDADANPGGVNGVPFINIIRDPCTGKLKNSNNDDPKQVLLAGLAPLIGPLILAGLEGPDELSIALNKGSKRSPKPSPKFEPPTNPPQLPPEELPPGIKLFKGKPTDQYPDGYWKLQNQSGQRLDPRTMKPGPHPDTHVPFPPGYNGPFDN